MKMIKAILLITCLITCLSTCTRSLNPSDNSNKNNHMSDINVCKSIRIPAEWEPHEAAWMRDNGPVYAVGCGAQWIQDWKFNAWGEMKWGRVSLPYRKDNLVPSKVASLLDIPVDIIDDYILERGNLEVNGIDTVILNWDCQRKRQEDWTKSRTEALFKQKFGIERVVRAPTSLPDEFTGGHIDGMARLFLFRSKSSRRVWC
jgi:agmatine/peptidylarginine deiminase